MGVTDAKEGRITVFRRIFRKDQIAVFHQELSFGMVDGIAGFGIATVFVDLAMGRIADVSAIVFAPLFNPIAGVGSNGDRSRPQGFDFPRRNPLVGQNAFDVVLHIQNVDLAGAAIGTA